MKALILLSQCFRYGRARHRRLFDTEVAPRPASLDPPKKLVGSWAGWPIPIEPIKIEPIKW
jgi:hypothetical protein